MINCAVEELICKGLEQKDFDTCLTDAEILARDWPMKVAPLSAKSKIWALTGMHEAQLGLGLGAYFWTRVQTTPPRQLSHPEPPR